MSTQATADGYRAHLELKVQDALDALRSKPGNRELEIEVSWRRKRLQEWSTR